jgi:RNA-directed DNA polymerase
VLTNWRCAVDFRGRKNRDPRASGRDAGKGWQTRRRTCAEGIKPLVEQFLHERGLELSPTKTVITHVQKGFDFLGQNVRNYPNGKLLIKPSKKNIKTFLDGIRGNIKAALGMSAADLIRWLNPKLRGWSN